MNLTVHTGFFGQCSLQDIFDTICYHLLRQGKQSQIDKSCAYVHPNGDKCAAGCLIQDRNYSIDFEGQVWNRVAESFNSSEPYDSLIRALQFAHDHESLATATPDEFRQAMEVKFVYLCAHYGLKRHVLYQNGAIVLCF